jgi:type IV pilus assembly protein PilB
VNLEEVVVDEGLVGRDALAAALREASSRGQSLARVLVEDNLVAEDALADAVARAVGTVVIDLDLGALETDAVRAIPEAIARRHLVIGVAAGASSLRVAFANPLDERAVRAVRGAAQLDVEPLVATVSALKAAIDREYPSRTTEIIVAAARPGPTSELRSEDTRQTRDEAQSAEPEMLERVSTATTGTSPLHRLENDATIEQRQEALLLALIEAGVITRADYLSALRRLMGKP